MVPHTRAQQSRGPCWRRLSPNNRKIEVEKGKSTLFTSDMLQTMGFELANVHLGTAERRDAIKRTSKIASVVG
jgi:hypothetical protein